MPPAPLPIRTARMDLPPTWIGRRAHWVLVAIPGWLLALYALLGSVAAAVPLLVIPGELGLDPGAGRDWYGIVLALLGLYFTISQLYQTVDAAKAARAAAEKATATAAEVAYRQRVELAARWVASAVTMGDRKQWRHAGLRLEDAADELRAVQQARPRQHARWDEHARKLDQWAAKFAAVEDGQEVKDFGKKRWLDEMARVREDLAAETAASATGVV